MSADGPPPPLPARARSVLAAYRDAEDMPADARARVRRQLLADEPVVAAPRRRNGTLLWALVGAAAAMIVLVALGLLLPERATEAVDRVPSAAPDQRDSDAERGRVHAHHGGNAARRGAGDAAQADAIEPGERDTTAHAEAAHVEAAGERAPGVQAASGDERAPGVGAAGVGTQPPALEGAADQRTPATGSGRRAAGGRAASRHASKAAGREPDAVPGGRKPETAAPSDARESTLDAERRLIARAWSALAHKNAADALSVARDHARRFGDGVLAPERRAIEAIARCQRDSNTSSATGFLRRHPRSPLAARVREACSLP